MKIKLLEEIEVEHEDLDENEYNSDNDMMELILDYTKERDF